MTTPDEEIEVPLGPDDVLWTGGPTMAHVDRWKLQHGPDSVYVTSVTPSRHVVWRTVTRTEYREFVQALEDDITRGASRGEANLDNEERIAERCILYPPVTQASLASEMAGLPSLIAQEVMEASGFAPADRRRL